MHHLSAGVSGAHRAVVSVSDAESAPTGAAFDRMFLEMIVGHHRGAVEMAQVELDEGADPAALELAQTIIDTQQAEITEMEILLTRV